MAFSSIPGYEVFVCFSGGRRSFISHLYRSLKQKGIRVSTKVFPNPSGAHLTPIRASKIAIVVVSEEALSSELFLEELQEILNCQRSESLALTVVPVYYGVDSCDVKRLAKEFRQNPEKVESRAWRNALMELACISGEHSSNCEDDAELILKITNDIWDKLSSLRFGGLVGMDLRMRRMYELLSLESKRSRRPYFFAGTFKNNQVLEIGIWGRGGLGKRTLARCVYMEISHSFDVCVFFKHYDHDPFVLRQELRSQLIQAARGPYTIPSDDTEWLKDQRVLLVLEGVDTAEQLDILMKDAKLFGPGSRTIVICEDKKLLLACGISLLYQVESLEFYEALELLSLHAFKQTDPPIGYEQLLARAIKIGNGYPRVIAAVGSELFGKPKEEWETVLCKYERPSGEGIVGTEIRDARVSDDEDRSSSRNTRSDCVGMDCHLEAVCGLLEMESGNEIRIVGIWGVGGVGKTTLARCVYEETMQYFHIHVFIENVEKIYQHHGPSGLHGEMLWENILSEALAVRSSKNGFHVTKGRLRNRKVLLIVDGVDNNEQIKDVLKVATWFGAGSRIMVTTRDENFLIANGLKHVYEVKCLRVHEALQLFYHFAFLEQSPSTRFKQLSVQAVQLAGRIPLSLKVLGSLLCGKSGDKWESILQKLERQQETDKVEVDEASTDVGVSRNEKANDYRKIKLDSATDDIFKTELEPSDEKSHIP